MLILPDSTSLGDTHLSPEENVAKLREGNRKLVADRKIPNQKLLEDRNQALGAPLAHPEFMRRLRLMKPSLVIQDGGVAGAIQIRYPVLDPDTNTMTTR